MNNDHRKNKRYPYIVALIVSLLIVTLIANVFYSLYKANTVYGEGIVDLNSMENETSMQTYAHIQISPDLISGPYETSNTDNQRPSFLLFLLDDSHITYAIPLINVDMSRYSEIDKYRNTYKDWVNSGRNGGKYVYDLRIDGYLVNYTISEDMQESLIEIGTEDPITILPYAIVAGNDLPDNSILLCIMCGAILLLLIMFFVCFRGIKKARTSIDDRKDKH